ncbi:zinc finger protein 665-like [Aedes albopictus]|uniref:C2h2-type zn-finger protein n=1 Tax=Aedes albopictus TaxID=7160 RepID=A0ABM1ZII4_AEDAL
METSQNAEQVCRLCLSVEWLADIFEQREVQQWIYNYLSITVSDTDTVSHLICASCRTRLEEFHVFRQRCLDAQKLLPGNLPTENQPIKLECDVCGKVFSVKRQLILHKRTHGLRKYKCSICSGSFLQPSRLARHMLIHDKTGNIKNDQPKAANDQPEDVPKQDPQNNSDVKANSENIDQQDDQSDLTIECAMCDKKFRVKKQLSDHRRQVHGPRDHKCTVCGKAFSSRSRLAEHATIHKSFVSNETGNVDISVESEGTATDVKYDPKKRQYIYEKEPCSLCKRMIKVIFMEGHLNRHKGIQPYKCEMGCTEEKFHCKFQRKTHYNDVHGWNAYECHICHQYFSSNRSCMIHKAKAHAHGHECQECFTVFATSSGLKKHIAKTRHTKTRKDTQPIVLVELPEVEQMEKEEDLFEAEDIKVEVQSDEEG